MTKPGCQQERLWSTVSLCLLASPNSGKPPCTTSGLGACPKEPQPHPFFPERVTTPRLDSKPASPDQPGEVLLAFGPVLPTAGTQEHPRRRGERHTCVVCTGTYTMRNRTSGPKCNRRAGFRAIRYYCPSFPLHKVPVHYRTV